MSDINPHQKATIQRIKEQLDKDLGSALSGLLSGPVDLKAVQSTFMRTISDFLSEKNEVNDAKIKCEVDKDDISKVNIIPEDLYTAFLLKGQYVPRWRLEGLKEYYLPGFGTITQYGDRFEYTRELSITFDVSIDPEKLKSLE